MPDRVLVGILAFFAFTIAGRWVYDSGLRRLSPEQKVVLVDAGSGIRRFGLIAVLPIIVAAYYLPAHAPFLFAAGLGGSRRPIYPPRSVAPTSHTVGST